jgi:hypothetical protein
MVLLHLVSLTGKVKKDGSLFIPRREKEFKMDITERTAVGIEAANNMLLHQGQKNPLKLLRKIDPGWENEGFVTLRFIFWLNNNPNTPVAVSIGVQNTETGWLPFAGSVYTVSDGLASYAFPHREDHFQPELLPAPYDD